MVAVGDVNNDNLTDLLVVNTGLNCFGVFLRRMMAAMMISSCSRPVLVLVLYRSQLVILIKTSIWMLLWPMLTRKTSSSSSIQVMEVSS